MRVAALSLIGLLVPGMAWAQGAVVDHSRARRYAGEEVTIEGPVARVAPGGGGSLWFSLGRPHPSASIVIVVLEEFAKGLDAPRSYEGAVIQVNGLIQTSQTMNSAAERSLVQVPPGGTPRTPFIVLQDLSRFKVISRSAEQRPDTTAIRPRPR